MSGHNKWSKIKHKKEASDKKRGGAFSKLAKIISMAAQKGADPDTNLDLKNALEQARSINMPSINIQRAIKRAQDHATTQLENIKIAAVGPEASLFIIEAVTDNTNRTISELKSILKDYEIKMVPPQSVLWMFRAVESDFIPQNKIAVSEASKNKILSFIELVEDHADVEAVHTNLE
ncbi:MAG: hypothetical protein COV31_01605 [Candidatus Yanofskybacteria bacterium CG10_big_fil_rev_8_21_14_0_10_46_23]|uniref:YebC/PmpR family DNA-binding transcriptional regulator n=1 Tax=Candidatus Yanofskybacteria bacterium CG10_big_fil_rev_8_21_14_0_10_46_23 TaxID=1975098 RepID=A0A2H0R5R9_9BACT|nr:MAG: hypothetical protein COV31_01605 [Candidatus Yanofskybacteria bacterium CG10_big_fil_rev_8_21_14_0_10_46_23]